MIDFNDYLGADTKTAEELKEKSTEETSAKDILDHLNELKLKTATEKTRKVNYNRMIKNGIVVRKGATLSKDRINKHLALYEIYFTFFTAYPDLYLDLIKPEGSGFHFYFYQRIFLRACLRYRLVYTTAPRALIEE